MCGQRQGQTTNNSLQALGCFERLRRLLVCCSMRDNIMMAGTVYGFGDLSRPVQSSKLFLNCALNVTMLEYLILWVLGKTLLLCSLSMLTAFLFVVIKSSAKTYLILVVRH